MKGLRANKVDMLHGPMLSRILLFGLPIFLGNVFQQLYNMVDSIVVGKFVGANALAAVGSTSPIAFLLVGIISGFAVGASIVVAQLIGAKQEQKIKPAIFTTLIFLMVLAIFLTAVGVLLAENIMHWINVPEEIMEDSVTYFKIYVYGMVFMALYNFFAAFLRALGDSTTPLIFLIISSVLNIFGDLYFVIGLHMGVSGVAWATVLAQLVSVVLCYLYVRKTSPYFKFGKGENLFDKSLLKDILRLGLPSGLQGSVSGLSMVAVQGLINSFGAVSIAAYTAASKMEGLCNLPMSSVSMALALYVGQNIGANNETRAKKGMYASAIFSVGISAVMSVVILVFGPSLMQLFVNASDVEVIEVGARFMRIWAPLIVAHALFECFVAFLRGVGDSLCSMISVFFDLTVRLVMAYVLAKGCGMGFMGIAWAIPCGWLCCSAFGILRYASGRWHGKAIKLNE